MFLQNSFRIDDSITTNCDNIASQRTFPRPTSFSVDDQEISRRVSAVGHPLTQPFWMPSTNGLRFNTQQPAVQDVSSLSFATSPDIDASPNDSCAEIDTSSIAFGSNSDSPNLPYNRLSTFRSHRVAQLQPPGGVSSFLQSQTGTSEGIGFMGDDNSGTYNLQQSMLPSLTSQCDMPRILPYITTQTALDGAVDRRRNLRLGQHPSTIFDSVQRSSHPTDAPPFFDTTVIQHIVSGNQTIKPEIQAKIHKGFFLADNKWTCYRRNYFSVSCSFSLFPFTHAPLFLKYADYSTEGVHSFAISLSAIVNAQYSENRELVQHTPKRDKPSERKPGKVVLQPILPPRLVLNHGSVGDSIHYGASLAASPPSGMSVNYAAPYSNNEQPSQPLTQHTFERIQFRKATASNNRSRAQQQYYNLVVELYAKISNPVGGEDTQWVKIARSLSHPLVVRGRGPGHYRHSYQNSPTSMKPNDGWFYAST